MVAISVLPAILDTRGKKSAYQLVHIIEVRVIEHSIYFHQRIINWSVHGAHKCRLYCASVAR